MVKKIKGFYNEIQPSPFTHGKVFEGAQIEVDEARCAQSVSRKTQRTRGKGKCAAMLFVRAGQRVDRSSAAERHDWRDFDVTQNLADEDVPFASCALLLFFTKRKIK